MEETIKIVKMMQITLRGHINYQFGVKSFKQYETIMERIKKNKSEFVKVIETLEVKRSEIISFEYFETPLEEINND